MRPRLWSLVVFFALAVLAGLGVLRLHVEFDVHRVLNPNEAEFDKVQALYDELPWKHPDALVAMTFGRAVEIEDLDTASNLARALESDPRIESVQSLKDILVVDARTKLPIPFPSTIQDGQSVYEAAWAHPLLRGTLMSTDGKSTALIVRAMRDDNNYYERTPFVESLTPQVERVLSGREDIATRIIGSSIVLDGLQGKLKAGIVHVLGLEVLLFLILLPLLFRTIRGSVMPIAVVLVAVLLNFGWMGWLGYPLTILDVAIPGLVVIIGLCDVIHLMQCFEESYAETREVGRSIRRMLANVGTACFYTSFTTGVGFLSLLATDHETVSTFGVKAAVSVVVTFFVVVGLVPAILTVFPVGAPRPVERVRLESLGYGRAGLVFGAVVLAIAFTAFGVQRVRVDSFLLEEIPASDPIAQNLAWFETEFSGILDVETRVKGDLRDPAVFAALEDFQREMLRFDGLTRVESITLYAREAIGNPQRALTAADLRTAFARLQLARDYFPRYLASEDLQVGRVVFKSKDVGLQRLTDYRERMRDLVAGFAVPLTIEPAGYVLMANNSTKLVVQTITQSLLLSMFVIAVFLVFLFRSIRLAIIALATNVLPLAFALGLSGWLGIELTIGSALIYCLGLGLAVDDSIHMLTRYLREKRDNPDRSTRHHLESTLHSSGKALIVTSIVLCVGTMCHLVAEFQSLKNVGMLLSSVIVVALCVDLWLLPLLVERLEAKRRVT